MEETERTYDWKSRWGDDMHFEYFKEDPPSFRNWWSIFDDDEPQEEEPKTAKEKLEQAEVAEYEVVEDTTLELGYAH